MVLFCFFEIFNLYLLYHESFSEATTKSKLASLNEKLDILERRLELLEVQVGTAAANPSLLNTWYLLERGILEKD